MPLRVHPAVLQCLTILLLLSIDPDYFSPSEAAWKFRGMKKIENVWVGQISRDIGIKFTSKTLVTHKIDPMVDEARTYIGLDIAASETLQAYGYVKGANVSSRSNPAINFTKDPYYSDGYRVLLIQGQKRIPVGDTDFLPWEFPGRFRYTD